MSSLSEQYLKENIYLKNTVEGLEEDLVEKIKEVNSLKIENGTLKDLVSILCEGVLCSTCCLDCPLRNEEFKDDIES